MESIEEILFNQEDESELSYWEFINNSDIVSDDDDDDDDIDSLSLDSLPSWNSSLSITNSKTQNPLQEDHDGYVEETPLEDLINNDDGVVEEQVKYDVGFYFYQQQQQQQHVVVNEEEEEEEEDYDDDDDDDELDDELVPWNLSGKMGRNRMRKLGKRVCAKMTNAKRNPFRYVKPGCVHGKHGLGMNQ